MESIQQHILEGKPIFVGLEDSKRTWKVCVRSSGVIVHETSMPATYEVLRNYFLNKFPECFIIVMYEAGFRGFSLHDNLVADGWTCVVTPPHTVTQQKCNRQKNDRIDARRLAKNLENGDYKACYVRSKEEREDRQLVRVYEQIQRDIVRVCNRIRRILEFHDLDRYVVGGKWNQSHYRRLMGMIDQWDLSASLHFSLELLLGELHFLWSTRKELLRRLGVLASSDHYHQTVSLLKSVPGIGVLTAIRLTLEIGDVSRFRREEEFSSYCGLIPCDYSTGDQNRKGHITKQGNRGIRSWLTESSWIAIRRDPALLAKYTAVCQHSGSSKKAIVAVAHKLAIRLRALLLKKQPYVIGKVK